MFLINSDPAPPPLRLSMLTATSISSPLPGSSASTQLLLGGPLGPGSSPTSQNRILHVIQRALWFKFQPWSIWSTNFPKAMSLFPVSPVIQGGNGAVHSFVHPWDCLGPWVRSLNMLAVVLDNTHWALRCRLVPHGWWDRPCSGQK